jgi:uncharacterized DUF497 family protein
MKFEWDEDKNLSNFRKHGIWFEEAQTIWADESSSEFFDPEHSDLEARFIRVGYSSVHRLLLVVFCERSDGDVIRLISARRATKSERRQHEEGI